MEDRIMANEEIEVIDECESSSAQASTRPSIGVIAAVAAAVAGGVGIYLYKTRDRREAKAAEKLRKKGYVVYKDDVEDDVVEVE